MAEKKNGNGTGAFTVALTLAKKTDKGNHGIYKGDDQRLNTLYIEKTGWGGDEPPRAVEVTIKNVS